MRVVVLACVLVVVLVLFACVRVRVLAVVLVVVLVAVAVIDVPRAVARAIARTEAYDAELMHEYSEPNGVAKVCRDVTRRTSQTTRRLCASESVGGGGGFARNYTFSSAIYSNILDTVGSVNNSPSLFKKFLNKRDVRKAAKLIARAGT